MDDDEDTPETGASAAQEEAVYEFEGFDVQVNERIALTPAAAVHGNGSGHG